MDLSSDPSREESRIIDRPLYRAGQAQSLPKPPGGRPPAVTSPSAKRPSSGKSNPLPLLQRRFVRAILISLWLLFLATGSYCVFLPDPIKQAEQAMRAVWEDPNLTRQEKWERSKQISSTLTDKQRMDMSMPPERRVKFHDDHEAFFKLSPEQQQAQLKQELLDFQKRMEEMKANGGRWPGGGGPKGGGFMMMGGGRNDDALPPETREQMGLKGAMRAQMAEKMGMSFGRGRGRGRGGPPQP